MARNQLLDKIQMGDIYRGGGSQSTADRALNPTPINSASPQQAMGQLAMAANAAESINTIQNSNPIVAIIMLFFFVVIMRFILDKIDGKTGVNLLDLVKDSMVNCLSVAVFAVPGIVVLKIAANKLKNVPGGASFAAIMNFV